MAEAGVAHRPGEVWLDDQGRPINAHGGGILRHDGTWYWYGEDKSPDDWYGKGAGRVSWVRCYSSRDLVTWHDEGTVLKAVPRPGHDLAPGRVVERPKVLFNAKTGKFVMWMHVDSPDYKYARAGVAVAPAPTGPFEYLGSVRPDGSESRDMTAWQDDDGSAYLLHSSEGNATLHIALLSDDYLRPSGRFVRVFEGRYREAPAVFRHEGRYYIVSSHCTGWKPNEAEVAVADAMLGEWKVMGNPCMGTEEQRKLTFESQGTFVLPVPGRPGRFVFMADRWNAGDLPDSRYVWLPLRVRDGKVSIRWRDAWMPSGFEGVREAEAPLPAAPTPARTVVTSKKGVGHWGTGMLDAPDKLACSWYYNWGPRPHGPTKAEFVPMIWSGGHATPENLEHVKSAGYRVLLAFNEPDGEGQADMTVGEALDLWPKLEATGLRLGSPGTTTGARWLDEFMEGAKARGYRVDFLCLHWYGDITKPDPVGDLRRYLTGYWEKYRLPIWLTEYSGADFDYHTRKTTVEDNARFAGESIRMLEALPFVERYAWFAPLVSTRDRYYPTVRMLTREGAFTPVGAAWVSAPW